MMNKKIMAVIAISLFVFAVGSAFAASDVKLTVESGTNSINILADPVAGSPGVAGAAFTLEYDSSLTVVSVESDFFQTFIDQGFTANQDGLDSSGFVSGYDQPLVDGEFTGSPNNMTRIAAARKDAGTITAGTVLFTVTFSGPAGTYPVSIIPTNLDNADAGYTTPQDIDLLIGSDIGAMEEFPVMLSAVDSGSATYIQNGDVTIQEFLNGDFNGDGFVTPTDAFFAYQLYLGDKLESEMHGNCDINGDGFITPTDAFFIYQCYLGDRVCN